MNDDALARLAHKYARLLALRRARAAGEAIPERGVFRDLAREFPGALYELDTLPIDALEARAAETEAAANGGEPARWMIWMSGYHALFRAALFVKARTRSKAELGDARATDLAAEASRHAGRAVDAAFARAAASPPGGRLQAVVLATLAAEAGEAPSVVKKVIFPQSRR
jgi:hypothetical protein